MKTRLHATSIISSDYEELQARYDAQSDAYHAMMGEANRKCGFYKSILDGHQSKSLDTRPFAQAVRAGATKPGHS